MCVLTPCMHIFTHIYLFGRGFLNKNKREKTLSPPPIQDSVKRLLGLAKTSDLHFPLSHFPWPGSLAVAPALSHAGSSRDSPGGAAGTELVPDVLQRSPWGSSEI